MTDHIKIKNIRPRIQYIANGQTNTYEFTFAIFNVNNIRVFLDENELTDGYEVVLPEEGTGGTVVFESAPENNSTITILRDLEIERLSDFQEGGALRANALNAELDYQIACTQQIAEDLNRSLVLPPYASSNDLDLTLPTPTPGKAIIWDSTATRLENSTIEINTLTNEINAKVAQASQYAQDAQSSSQTAASQAQEATAQAVLASQKAVNATNQATLALQEVERATNLINGMAQKDGSNLNLNDFISNLGFNGLSTASSGYYTFPDGFMIQWGQVHGYSNWNQFGFPTPFPNQNLMVIGSCASDDGFSGNSAQGIISIKKANASSFYARYGNDWQNGLINYIAIGY